MVSSNFSISEVEKSQTAIRLGVNNKLPKKYYLNAANLAEYVLEPIRKKFGPFSLNSWFRSYDLNKIIGGSTTSQHNTAQAADFEIHGIHNIKLGKWIYKNLEFDQLIFEFTNSKDPRAGWIHCSYNKDKNRNQVLKAYKYRGRSKYKILNDKEIKAL